MKKFKATVCRISYSYHDIEVEAKNEIEAKKIILDTSGDYEYSEKTADYKIVDNSIIDIETQKVSIVGFYHPELEYGLETEQVELKELKGMGKFQESPELWMISCAESDYYYEHESEYESDLKRINSLLE